MTDLTPDALAETERLIYAHEFPVEKVASTILDLIAAVRAERAIVAKVTELVDADEYDEFPLSRSEVRLALEGRLG